jgi:hypothetical protein
LAEQEELRRVLAKILVPGAVGKTGIVVAFGVITEFMVAAARFPEPLVA